MKNLFIALILFLTPTMMWADNLFAGGKGTKASPYTIATAEQLAMLAQKINAGDADYNSKYYKLTADINLSGYGEANKGFNNGNGWIPIGTANNRFAGSFDGNGKRITGLHINDANLKDAGLFGNVCGIVINLGIVDADISASDRVGGITGSVNYGEASSVLKDCYVANCYVTGMVKGSGWVGGIAGEIFSKGIVSDCYSLCTVVGQQNVGGITGSVIDSGLLSYCYATGNIVANLCCAGGLAGYVHPDNSKVVNCVALNRSVTITAKNEAKGETAGIGRIVGNMANTLSNNYASDLLKDKNNKTTSWTYISLNNRDGADVSAIRFMTASFWKTEKNWNTIGWDKNVWVFVDGELPIFKYDAKR